MCPFQTSLGMRCLLFGPLTRLQAQRLLDKWLTSAVQALALSRRFLEHKTDQAPSLLWAGLIYDHFFGVASNSPFEASSTAANEAFKEKQALLF